MKSGFTTLVNKRALHIISTPCVFHRHVLASKAFPEYLKIVLKHVSERVNFTRARARVFSALQRWINWSSMLNNVPNSYVATVAFLNFGVDWAKISNAVEARIWNYYTFSKYLSVWGRDLLNDDHITKNLSRLIPNDNMRASLAPTVARISEIVRRKQVNKRLTELLTD